MSKCKRLPATATKAERKEAHKIKMGAKVLIRDYNFTHPSYRREYVLANISQHHEYYGDTPAEHEKRKQGLLI